MTEGTDMNQIEKVARALAKADGLDFDEVCGVDANPDDGYCDSGTCVAAHWEEHDAEQARRWYMHLAKAAIAVMPVQAEPVAWLYVRRADAWPPAPPRVSLTRWPEDGATRDYWDEHALGIIPTPPAGGSDAE